MSTSNDPSPSGAAPGARARGGRFAESRSHLARAQLELLKAVRAALAAIEGGVTEPSGENGPGHPDEPGGVLGTLVGMVMRYADRVARRREADARLKILTTLQRVLSAERDAAVAEVGKESPTVQGFDAVIRALEREGERSRARS